jgi:hypothetical protein
MDKRKTPKAVHPVNEYASRQHMIARLKVEAVFL